MSGPLDRRRLLRGLGSAVALGVAGCTDTAGDTDPEQGPGGSADAPLEDRACPPVRTDHDRAVCSHTVDTAEAAVSLDATPERAPLDGELPAEEIELRLHNQSTADLTFNPNSWAVWYDDGDEWLKHVVEVSGTARVTVPAGETHLWTLREALGALSPDPSFEPGLWAVVIGVPDPETTDAWLSCLALVRLGTQADSPPPGVSQTDTISNY